MKNISGPVVTGGDFFDRKNQVGKLWNQISKGQNIILSAPRRMGKTSTLYKLKKDNEHKLKIVYIDCTDCKNIEALCEKIITLWKDYLLPELNVTKYFELNENKYLEILESIFSKFQGKAVVLLDEFDYFLEIVERQKDTNKLVLFLTKLRYFRQTFLNIQWVFTVENQRVFENFSASLFNDFTYFKIGLLSLEDAKLFLKVLIQRYDELVISEDKIDFILKKLDWYIPFVLQVFFSRLYEKIRTQTDELSYEAIDEIIDQIVRRSSSMFDVLLRNKDDIPQESIFAKRLYYYKHLKFSSLEETKNSYLNENKKLDYALKSFQTINFKGIKEVEISSIPVDSQWIFFVGENGSGKTTILQSLTLSLLGLIDDFKNANYLTDDLQIGVEFLNYTENEIKYFGMFDYSFSHLACYGPFRLELQKDSSDNEEKNKSGVSYGLFNDYNILLSIDFELKKLHWKKEGLRYNAIKNTLCLLTNFADIRVDDNDMVLYYEKSDDDTLFDGIGFKQLASGHKSIIAMVGDMMIRLFKSQPTVTEPSELAGIVIVDELDLHWHPKMQREIPKLLSSIFPKVQFIASTHSLVPLLGAPENSVLFKVNRTKEEGITVEKVDIDFQALSTDTILRDIFDLEKYMSDQKITAWERYIELKGMIHFEKDEATKLLFIDERERLGDKYNFGV